MMITADILRCRLICWLCFVLCMPCLAGPTRGGGPEGHLAEDLRKIVCERFPDDDGPHNVTREGWLEILTEAISGSQLDGLSPAAVKRAMRDFAACLAIQPLENMSKGTKEMIAGEMKRGFAFLLSNDSHDAFTPEELDALGESTERYTRLLADGVKGALLEANEIRIPEAVWLHIQGDLGRSVRRGVAEPYYIRDFSQHPAFSDGFADSHLAVAYIYTYLLRRVVNNSQGAIQMMGNVFASDVEGIQRMDKAPIIEWDPDLPTKIEAWVKGFMEEGVFFFDVLVPPSFLMMKGTPVSAIEKQVAALRDRKSAKWHSIPLRDGSR